METWIELNLSHLKNNYEYIKNKTGKEICSVVKADGYGMGLYEISKELEKIGTDSFAVAFLKEGMNLRKQGIKKDIIVFNYVDIKMLSKALKYNLILTLYSMEQLDLYIEKIKKDISKLRFHIKINSGINRLGIDEVDVERLVSQIKLYDIKVEGIYSHFGDVNDDKFTEEQYETLIRVAKRVEAELGIKIKKHIANSPASLLYNKYYLDMVRVGMLLYGLQPLPENNPEIKEIFTWKSVISGKRYVEKNERISYGKYKSDKKRLIATVPVGYSHGYMRQLSNKSYVMINNKKCMILGDICMDQMVVDISEAGQVDIGDEVTLLGGAISAETLGEMAGTIADDILCKISPKIERVIKF
jgi:alanine racemase